MKRKQVSLVFFLRWFSFWSLVCFFLGACGSVYAGGGREKADDGHRFGQPENIGAVELEGGRRMRVVASTTMIGDVLKNVGGGEIELIVVMGLGEDPHTFEPTPRDLSRIHNGDVVFVNGFELEEGLLKVIENAGDSPIIEISQKVLAVTGDEQEQHGDIDPHNIDPHTWMSVRNVISWVRVIEDSLAALDPPRADIFRANAQKYLERLRELEKWAFAELALIPQENRVIAADHRTFNYFARNHGFEVLDAVIPSFSTSSEVSLGHMDDLIHILEEQRVPALFLGNTASRTLQNIVATLQDELDYPIQVVSYFSGSLSNEVPTFVDFFRHNVNQLVKGLSTR